jgi:hypothetical protein
MFEIKFVISCACSWPKDRGQFLENNTNNSLSITTNNEWIWIFHLLSFDWSTDNAMWCLLPFVQSMILEFGLWSNPVLDVLPSSTSHRLVDSLLKENKLWRLNWHLLKWVAIVSVCTNSLPFFGKGHFKRVSIFCEKSNIDSFKPSIK